MLYWIIGNISTGGLRGTLYTQRRENIIMGWKSTVPHTPGLNRTCLGMLGGFIGGNEWIGAISNEDW